MYMYTVYTNTKTQLRKAYQGTKELLFVLNTKYNKVYSLLKKLVKRQNSSIC